MLIMKIPTAENDLVQKTKIIPFKECVKQLKYYFSDIKEIRSRLRKGEAIKTPYFEFRCMAHFEITPELSIIRRD